MRRHHSSITPGEIQQLALQQLSQVLPWKPKGRAVSVDALLQLLLIVASRGLSLYAVVRRCFRFSAQTAYQAVKANLPAWEPLTAGLVAALQDVLLLSRRDRQRDWTIAIDTHYVPYYGKRTAWVIGGPRKAGTQHFHAYATAVLLHKRRRYLVAFCPMFRGDLPHVLVERLLGQIAAVGLNVRGVTLDSAFDSGETLLLLQQRRLAYSVPLRRKGRGANPRNNAFVLPQGTVKWFTWETKKTYRLVRTRIYVWHGKSKTMVFAFCGWSRHRAKSLLHQARWARRKYRERFGIETSYRQKNQTLGKTTSRDGLYRLLLEGIAYLVRQLWVRLTEQLARAHGRGPNEWIGELTLKTLSDWLADSLLALHPENRAIPLVTKTCGKLE